MNNNSLKWPKILNAHFPWLFMMVLITIQSSLTSEQLHVEIPIGVDKLVHFTIFGILGWLMTRGFVTTENRFLNMNFVWLVPLISGLFAILDEYHQALVPGRFPEFLDWVADILGGVFFMWLYKIKILVQPHENN